MQPYTEQFYKDHREGSRLSAREIVPLILALIQPKSVIDIGCGVGTWLSVFKELGCKEILGVDGDYVNREMLEIPAERFFAFDLSKPFRLDRQFDLVVSLEVAEHLPDTCAEVFVDSLTRLGPVILFSAAIPFQGGNHHVNEQWPDYWAQFFQEKDFLVIDAIRKQIWSNNNVEYCYAQNILVFARQDYVASHALLNKEAANTAHSQLSIVHPRKYLEEIEWIKRLGPTAQDIATLIPPEDIFIFVDQEQLGSIAAAWRHAIPFLERDGHYWGLPPDDNTAIRELERLRQSGARFCVFGWPAFWWFDYYIGFYRYLCLQFPCVLKNDRLVIFDLH